MKEKSTLTWLRKMTKKYRAFVVLLTVLEIIVSGLAICYALVMKQMVDRAVAKDGHGFVIGMTGFGMLVLGDSTRHEEAAAQAQESLAQTQAVTIESLKEMSDEQLKNIGFTDDQVTAFRELEEQSQKTGIPIEDLMNNVDRLSAKSLIFDSFKNIGDSLINTLKSIGSAWNETFSVKDIGNTIYSAIEAFISLQLHSQLLMKELKR